MFLVKFGSGSGKSSWINDNTYEVVQDADIGTMED